MNPIKLEAIVNKVRLPSLKFSDNEYDFTLQGKNKNWNVRLIFIDYFPLNLPIAKLLNTNIIGTIPHVNISGTICVEESDSVLIDYHRPIDIICYLLDEITHLLNRASLKIFSDELTNEYEGYFQSSTPLTVNSFYSAQDITESVYLKIAFPKRNKSCDAIPSLLFANNENPPNHYSNISETQKNQVIKIIHIPLHQSVFPPSNKAPITSKYIFEIVELISNTNKIKLGKLLAKEKNKRQFFILLSMPRNTGERTQLLLSFLTEKSTSHPLLNKSNEWKIQLHLLTRHNKSYLLERGGAENKLSNAKVSIIGCGSVGGEIASMIAKAGLGELTLIDHDTMEPDNIYRHRLGGASLNYVPDQKTAIVKKNYKVLALRSMLMKDLPYIYINAKPNLFENILDDKDFLGSDIIIVAVGSPTLSLKINKILKSLNLNKVIFCWNEAAGIGGHSVALDLTVSCYECLYCDENYFSKYCELNLLHSGQNISKNLTGCAGVFTPFSYLDSSQTANLAAKHCIDMLLHNTHSNALSWKGENYAQLDVTQRYNNIALKESVKIKCKDSCTICHE